MRGLNCAVARFGLPVPRATWLLITFLSFGAGLASELEFTKWNVTLLKLSVELIVRTTLILDVTCRSDTIT